MLAQEVLANIRQIFKTQSPVIIYPASGTGAWEAALTNTLSPGEKVLMYETGWFAHLWTRLATKLGLDAEVIEGDWRSGVAADQIGARLSEDKGRTIKAVCVVHNETSTGVASDIAQVRKAIDAAGHPALLMADTISSLASIDFQHDDWGVDVTIAGSQKGLMLPPGLSFNAVSEKALAAARSSRLPCSYWDWEAMIAANTTGFFPYTPATNLLQGLKVAMHMLLEEGLPRVFARHRRAAESTRAAVRHWGFETQCGNDHEHSNSLTAVRLPDRYSADALRAEILTRCNMSLGNGLGKLADRVFRIGHLGDFSETTVTGVITGIEMGLSALGIPHQRGAALAAQTSLLGNSSPKSRPAE